MQDGEALFSEMRARGLRPDAFSFKVDQVEIDKSNNRIIIPRLIEPVMIKLIRQP